MSSFQIDSSASQNKQLTAAQFAAKFQSKREVYLLLTLDAGAYLPSHSTLTIYFLKDIISGKKKWLKSKEIRHLAVPQYKSLKVEVLLKYIKDNPTVAKYLPIEKEILQLPKQYLVNVIYSVIGSNFSRWVRERIDSRNETIVKQKNLAIEMDPEILNAFNQSTAVSTSKGIGANLLKAGTKRRRTHQEIQDQKEEAKLKEESINDKLQQLEALNQKCQELEHKANSNQQAEIILRDMMDKGQLIQNLDGSVQVAASNQDPNDSQSNMSQNFTVMQPDDSVPMSGQM